MNCDAERDNGCFDIAPYDTKCASCPSNRVICVVTLPPLNELRSQLRERDDHGHTYTVEGKSDLLPLFVSYD